MRKYVITILVIAFMTPSAFSQPYIVVAAPGKPVSVAKTGVVIKMSAQVVPPSSKDTSTTDGGFVEEFVPGTTSVTLTLKKGKEQKTYSFTDSLKQTFTFADVQIIPGNVVIDREYKVLACALAIASQNEVLSQSTLALSARQFASKATKERRYIEAVAALDAFVDPDKKLYARDLLHAGIAYRQTGDLFTAGLRSEAATNADPDLLEAIYNRACYESLQGNQNQAFSILEYLATKLKRRDKDVRQRFRNLFEKDEDLTLLRHDNRFKALLKTLK